MILKLLSRLCMSLALIGAVSCTAIPGSNISGQVFSQSVLPNFDSPQVEASVLQITPSLISKLAEAPLANDSRSVWSENRRSDYDYRVGVGDVLSIVVWDHPELREGIAARRPKSATRSLAPNLHFQA